MATRAGVLDEGSTPMSGMCSHQYWDSHNWFKIVIPLYRLNYYITVGADVPITMEDLPALMNLLVEIAFMWRFIGLQLHLTPGTLNSIAHSCITAEVCLMSMLTRWLDESGHTAMVSKLIAALQSRSVNQLRIAEEVQDFFHTKKGLSLINSLCDCNQLGTCTAVSLILQSWRRGCL